MLKKVEIYADGAAKGNPGPGGFGTVVIHEDGARQEFAGGVRLTTNNRMEILAVIIGLENVKERSNITIMSDSSYVTNAFNKRWLYYWKRDDWVNHKGDAVKNADLWERLLAAKKDHRIKMVLVKGHSGITENERCDKLATKAAADKAHHHVDEVYEAYLAEQEALKEEKDKEKRENSK